MTSFSSSDKADPSGILREAFQQRDAMLAYAFSILRDWSLAEDAVQEAVLALHAKQDQLNDTVSVGGWLRKAVRYEALMVLRKRKRHVFLEEGELLDVIQQRFEAVEPSLPARLQQKKEALRVCMRRVRQEVAELLVQHYQEGCSIEVLAQQQGVKPGTLRVSLHRARRRLKECVSRRLEGAV